MDTVTEDQRDNGKIVRIIGEGEEEGDELSEVLYIMQALHECMHEARRSGKAVRIEISVV